MVTPSAVVRVNRWLALPMLSVPPVGSGTPGTIGHAMAPELAGPEVAVPPPAPDATSPCPDGGVVPAASGPPDGLPSCEERAPADENTRYPPTVAAVTTTAAVVAISRRRWRRTLRVPVSSVNSRPSGPPLPRRQMPAMRTASPPPLGPRGSLVCAGLDERRRPEVPRRRVGNRRAPGGAGSGVLGPRPAPGVLGG